MVATISLFFNLMTSQCKGTKNLVENFKLAVAVHFIFLDINNMPSSTVAEDEEWKDAGMGFAVAQ